MTQDVLPFRFPEKDDETAGLCKDCLEAPIRVVPCVHMDDAEVETEGGFHEALPADAHPEEKDTCAACGCWRDEHKGPEVDHVFLTGRQIHARKQRLLL